MTTNPDTMLMTVRKAEQVSGVSKTKLYKWIGEGRLKARYVGKFMRVHRDDLAATIAALPKVGE